MSQRKTKKFSKNSKNKSIKIQNGSLFPFDIRHTNILIKAANDASSNAIRESKALGLNITYLDKGVIYIEHADGSKDVINNFGA